MENISQISFYNSSTIEGKLTLSMGCKLDFYIDICGVSPKNVDYCIEDSMIVSCISL